MRDADRQSPAPKDQLPPRMTRPEPAAGPCGSVTGSAVYLPYQSCTHSHTLPCMSYRPQAFRCSCPTGCVVLPALSANQAYLLNWPLSSPKLYAVVEPARAAYSHSASVGRRYFVPPSLALSLSINCCTSSQETLSTGRLASPLNWLGLFPITASHWPWVTSWIPR